MADLRTYRGKRKAGTTPEPFGGGGGRHGLFVVQKHAATRLHYDFRLELGGVLKSWAVPKGPSFDPKTKRLAVQVEDHPIEYADFEGVIPADNYGAGPVIVWDQGRWVSQTDPHEGLVQGKLVFELRGHKLRGLWELVRIGKKGKDSRNWLLFKKADAWAGDRELSESSVFSGLTLEELEHGSARLVRLSKKIDKAGVAHRQVALRGLRPMLATPWPAAFTDLQWLYEFKYDGFRLLAACEGGEVRLAYRSGGDATRLYPDLVRALRALPCKDVLLDGEVVVLDEQGQPEFQRLQERGLLTRARDIEQACVDHPATYYLFDLLGFEGRDLRGLPLEERKTLLQQLVPAAGPLRYADHVLGQGEALYAEVERRGLEGIVAKRRDSTYVSQRSPQWRKVRCQQSGDFVIVGFTKGKGGRVGLGALHLATRTSGGWRYAGRVGTGFDDATLRRLRDRLDSEHRASPPTGAPRGKEHQWVVPRLVCEVRYREVTRAGLLRHPVFMRLRDDKHPVEAETQAGVVAAAAAAPRDVAITNPDKIFWPDDGYRKRDLVHYYREAAPWLLPYLKDRPVVLTRYPDGITGKSFFQKDAPDWAPAWLRTTRVWSEDSQRDIDYFLCDDDAGLMFLANLGTIPLHIWASRLPSIANPDWCILDLDPKGAPFEHVVKVARAAHVLCDDLELPSFVKTTGSTGLHVLLPLGARRTFEEAKMFGELLAEVIAARLPDIATTARSMARRGGRVYIDFLQNGHGKLLVAPFSVRPLPSAPVSMPLRWSEVTPRLRNESYTIKSGLRRMQRLGSDPLLALLRTPVDLARALVRLEERLG